jgi:hypothetical protein
MHSLKPFDTFHFFFFAFYFFFSGILC